MITWKFARCVGACSQAPVVWLWMTTSTAVLQPNKFPKLIQEIQNQEAAH
jgi:NADH:ubiquinone oxidoreductase subunit E